MKKKVMLLMFMAALAFAGCSNDEDLTTEGGSKGPETGELRYLAVNIVTPKESTNRAASDEGFEDGTDNEVAVNSARFCLLAGNTVAQIADVNDADALKPWHDGTSNSVDKVSSAVLVINGEETKPENITGILAVLNPTEQIKSAITTGKSLTDVKKVIEDYKADGTAGSFIMSNSAYVDGTNEQLASAVNAQKNLAKTADAAKANPVEIYVERVVAQIKTTKVSSITNNGAPVELGGTEKKLNIDIKGIQIANCAQKSYLFKNIDGFKDNAPFTNWTDAGNYRSYWAKMPGEMGALADLKDQTKYMNYSWNQINGSSKIEGLPNVNQPLDEALAFYVQENIFGNDGYAAGPGHTAVLVTAQLQDPANGNQPCKLVKLAGQYYNYDEGKDNDDAREQLAGYLNNSGYRIKTVDGTSTTYTTLAKNCLEWLTKAPEGASEVKGWEGFTQIKESYVAEITNAGKSFVKYDATSKEYEVLDDPKTAIDQELTAKKYRAWKWTDGMCYYFVDIEHFGNDGANPTPTYLKGIIRNHIYSLTLNSLQGPGVPVFDPDEVIIPEKPDDDELFYLAAQINILKWKLVKQTIDFNN